MTTEEAVKNLLMDPMSVAQMSWSFLLGVSVKGLLQSGSSPEGVHEVVDIALENGVPDSEQVRSWLFLVALAATELCRMGATRDDLHTMVDAMMKGGSNAQV